MSDRMVAGLLNCWNCHMNDQKFGCSSCHIARYCSEICQKEHWKLLHSSQCKYLSGKKLLRGTTHNQEKCKMCRNESGKACWIQTHDKDLEIFRNRCISMAKSKYNTDWKNVNLPFQLGEVSGKYIDFLDKVLSYLQGLLSILMSQYPEHVCGKLLELLQNVVSFRAAHWAMAMIYAVESERIERTTEFLQRTLCEDTSCVLQLFNKIRNIESQEGVSVWNSFMFLYEMLGIYSMANIFSSVDVESFNEIDRKLAMNVDEWDIIIKKEELCLKTSPFMNRISLWFESLTMSDELEVVVKNKEYRLRNESFVNHMEVLVESFDSLNIFNDNFQLKEFKKIYEQFLPTSEQSVEEYSCEVCQNQVDKNKCQYVYHTYYPHLEPSFGQWETGERRPVYDGTSNTGKEMSMMEMIVTNHTQQMVEGKAYITYNIGSGLKMICNQGDCKDIYGTHVARYRDRIKANFLALLSKYRTKFCYLQCWVCKIHCGESHRCKTCKSRIYCSRECQTKDWKLHETICEQLEKAGDQVKSESQVRRQEGRIREEKVFRDGMRGHENCDDKDCNVAHRIKSLYGKLKQEVQTEPEAEVD